MGFGFFWGFRGLGVQGLGVWGLGLRGLGFRVVKILCRCRSVWPCSCTVCLVRPKGRRRAGRVQHRVLHGPRRPELVSWKTAWDAGVSDLQGSSFRLLIWDCWESFHFFRSLIFSDRVTSYQVNSGEFTLVAEPTASLSAEKRPILS